MELLAIRKTEQLVEACVLTPPVAHALQADNGAIRAALWLAPPLARLEAVRIVKDAVKKARVKKDSCKSQQNQSFRTGRFGVRASDGSTGGGEPALAGKRAP
jgi:hypothetical protein